MTTILRTVAEIKAEVERLKGLRRLREDAAACVAAGDTDEASRRLFRAFYGREYDFNDSHDRVEFEGCRGMVHNPLLVLDCDLGEFARVVAEVAAPGPERDARAAERAVRDGMASRLPSKCTARSTSDPEKCGTASDPECPARSTFPCPTCGDDGLYCPDCGRGDDPWAEYDGERWELGPDEHFQPDPEEVAEYEEACRLDPAGCGTLPMRRPEDDDMLSIGACG